MKNKREKERLTVSIWDDKMASDELRNTVQELVSGGISEDKMHLYLDAINLFSNFTKGKGDMTRETKYRRTIAIQKFVDENELDKDVIIKIVTAMI